MAIKDTLKVSFKTFFNPRGWLGYDTLKASTKMLVDISKGLFVPAQPGRVETFDEAMQRQGLTEKDIKARADTCRFFVRFYIVFAVISISFSFYLFFHGSVLGGFLGFAALSLFLSQAFRYHFWLFQIKNRKLGCTFAEWRSGQIRKEG